ncbi:MAG: FkbM family methyltransferase [Deltaproteobacteria bacterium]
MDECRLLNKKSSKSSAPYRNVTFFPVALSEKGGVRHLHITRHRGASSLLAPLPEVGRGFCRTQYTTVDKKIPIDTVPLGEFVEKQGLKDLVFLKIDVEGLELEILRSARKLLENDLLVVRAEVAFFPTRAGQPLFCDIVGFLQQFRFLPMGFAELHHWRRLSGGKHMKWTKGAIPFSRGQLIHGDMIFFRDPDTLTTDTEEGARVAIKAAFFAMAYGFVDHAHYILAKPGVRGLLEKKYGLSVDEELGIVSANLASMYGARGLFSRLGKGRG